MKSLCRPGLDTGPSSLSRPILWSRHRSRLGGRNGSQQGYSQILIHAQRACEILRPIRLKPALRQRDLENHPSSNPPRLVLLPQPIRPMRPTKKASTQTPEASIDPHFWDHDKTMPHHRNGVKEYFPIFSLGFRTSILAITRLPPLAAPASVVLHCFSPKFRAPK